MSQYGYFATVYDRMMDNIPYEEWKQYILQLFFRYGVKPCGKITELGCGTGVMTRLLADDGFDMTGVDLSEEMLYVARSREHEPESPQITYFHQDMRELSLPAKQDGIISICDSMNYLLTLEDLYKTMLAARNNLNPGGIFIFDLKTEHFYEYELDGKTFSEDMGDFSYIWRNEYSTIDHIHRYYLEFHVNGKVIREIHRQRVFGATDIKKAALNAGFTRAIAYDAFTFSSPRKKSDRIYIIMKND